MTRDATNKTMMPVSCVLPLNCGDNGRATLLNNSTLHSRIVVMEPHVVTAIVKFTNLHKDGT